MINLDNLLQNNYDVLFLIVKWGFGLLKRWFVGCTGCTLQTLYAWLVRGLCVCMVGILIYRILRLSLGCDSWHGTMLLI